MLVTGTGEDCFRTGRLSFSETWGSGVNGVLWKSWIQGSRRADSVGKGFLKRRDDSRDIGGRQLEYIGVESARLGSEFGLFHGTLSL